MDLQNRAEAGSDGHDESVLNPEMPNETDLTKKERRRIEKEKLKGMGTGKKLQYIWMYYKIPLFRSQVSSRTDEDGAFHCGGECREL